VETLAELPFIGDQVVCLSHDQGACSGPAERGAPKQADDGRRRVDPARADPAQDRE
jgi:hypothetical protein